MRYRRVLLWLELGADPDAALAWTRRLAPGVDHLVVAASPAAGPRAGAPSPLRSAADGALEAWLGRTRLAASRAAAGVEVGIVTEPAARSLEEVVVTARVELVVAGPLPPGALSALGELRRRRRVAVAWLPRGPVPPAERPLRELFCFAVGEGATRAVASFLRDHGERSMRATVFSLGRLPPDELAAALEVSGVRPRVELTGGLSTPPWRALDAIARERPLDVVVLARFPERLLASAPGSTPVLVLPPPAATGPAVERPLDAPDLVDAGDGIRARLGSAFGIGRNPPLDDQEVAFVAEGRVAAVVRTRGGTAELPPGIAAATLGVFRTEGRAGVDAIAAIERTVAVVRPGPAPLVLFDADLPEGDLQGLGPPAGVELLAVRLRPVRSCHLSRRRLRGLGLPPRVIDAGAVLDEGEAVDVSDALDPVRLARVATRMRLAGFRVVAVVPGRGAVPVTSGFAALRADEVARRPWKEGPTPPRLPSSLAARLDVVSAAAPLAGNRVEVEVDNATARRWLLGALEGCRTRVHLQAYIVADDALGRHVEAALRAAARRGAAVRVLVDSLHGHHGSLGLSNPLLERLAACPGVEVRGSRPLLGLPSLEALKHRDHRKLVIVDGRVALVGGRNLGREYYTGFDEVQLAAATPWRDVPWLDAGTRVEGPAVAALERSFRDAWTAAGGAGFDVAEPPGVGATPVRVVVHHGLRDAATLEAYLALVETARSHVYVVNGFPLLLELQHALLRALRRGVRVRMLVGHVAPTHGGEPFQGDWATARAVGTSFVHSRMDALVAAGGEGFLFALRDLPGWAPGLELVHPHVHAKLLSVDGRAFAVGSANLDVTASYWEDELLLVVEDEAAARQLEARVEALLAGSTRVDRHDPAWQQLARRREWLRWWPGVLSI